MEDCTIITADRGPLVRIDVRGPLARYIKMNDTPDPYGRFKLQPAETRPKKFLKIVLMAIVWNALTGLAIYAIVTQWKGGMQYLVAAVLLIFALIGLVMIWSIFYQFLWLFSPRLTLTANSNNFRFGGRFDLNWSFTMPQLVKKLEFWLDLEEDEKEAKSSDIGECVYMTEDRSQTGSGQITFQLPETSPRGQATIVLPENSPKPFITSRKIHYVLKVKAEIKYLPDIDQDFVLLLSE
jgi:hypothetical protein